MSAKCIIFPRISGSVYINTLRTLPLIHLKVYDILTKKVYVFWQTKISTFNQINTKKIAIKISNRKRIWVSITINIKEINRV